MRCPVQNGSLWQLVTKYRKYTEFYNAIESLKAFVSQYIIDSVHRIEADMPGKQAKILSDHQIQSLLVFAAASRYPRRNHLMALFSVKAGLRAGEIAKLTWDMVLGPTGEIGTAIELRDCAAKKNSGRLIPIHPILRIALMAWRKTSPGEGPIMRSERGGAMNSGSIVNWFAIAYRAVGLNGCSSHSGRRTFITRAARLVHKAGGSLRDVQLLAGHRSIQTTQRYIDGDSDAQRKLVSMI
jgi:integrase